MATLTYFKKEPKECPICNATFYEEIMFTGGMRQVSIRLIPELRTIYKLFNGKPVVPFIYEVMTCPKCYYSALNIDFDNIYIKPVNITVTDKKMEAIIEKKREILKEVNQRKELIKNISDVSFSTEKNLTTGLAAYILAEYCYNYFSEKQLPVVKKAICSIRAAWLASDLDLTEIADKYYRLAHKYYSEFTSGTDNTQGIKLGPDWGNNFGFDGARYLKALLDIKYINDYDDIKQKFEILGNVRSTLSRLRGYGKASKDKVRPLLRLTEEMFEAISPQYDKLKEIIEKQGDNLEGVKEEIKFEFKTEEIKEAKEEVEAKEEEKEEEFDNYHKAAIEIVKYGIKSGIKKDSVNDIIEILKQYF
ncbi:MAG TPA: DUF2225 domain-containing protein [bacterium]|nr:DUF2225 domain-containing protein [bacterium]